MSVPENRLAQAWLESPAGGVIEMARDWRGLAAPAFSLGAGAPEFVTLTRQPAAAFAQESGYFADEQGTVYFVAPLARHPEVDPARTAVYLAGNFNGWQEAVGREEWRLQPATLGGERVLLLTEPPEKIPLTPPPQFKFVTRENHWLEVPHGAPNAVRDEHGNVNRAFDPARTGSHRFHFTLAGPLDLSRPWTVSWRGADGRVPLRPGEFFFQLRSEAPLGAWVRPGETVFRLFAPRATQVRLFLCDDLARQDAAAVYALDRHELGVWHARLDRELHGWYYWYALAGPQDAHSQFDPQQRVLDPYALATTGRAGPGIVLDRARLGAGDRGFRAPAWQDLVIAEAHVRDLTAFAPIKVKPAERRGFTGLRKWVESEDFYLHRLGVNAVELQPVQEFDNATPEEYHWGYMPVNWFAPSSAYALDPARASQVKEFQELVAAFHRRGLAVLLDVVYNHVGVPAHLLAIDKLYYFEQDATGALANWSGCGNDTRCRAAMLKRLIIDSLTHLIEVYGVDGFRFDLAELIGADVLREIEAALKRVNPGVVLIAEPWSFRGQIVAALRTTGFASWNDGFRNFLRDYVRGAGDCAGIEYFLRGSPGHFAAWPAQTVNYTESHDDRTWIDNITENPGGNGDHPTLDDRRRTHLMAAILFASLGLPMLAAGQDFLRSKQGVNNTYQRGDLNALDYKRIYRFPATHAYFADWIAFRRSAAGGLLRQYSRPGDGFFQFAFAPGSTAVAAVYNADGAQGGRRLLFAINPTQTGAVVPLGGAAGRPWRQLADEERFFGAGSPEPGRPVGASLPLPPLSCALWLAEE